MVAAIAPSPPDRRFRSYPKGVCQTADCLRPQRARGACFRHDPGRPERASFADRLLGRIDASGDCWLWTGPKDRRGYGHVHTSLTTTAGAHRAVYELLVGPVPDGLVLDHLCRVRACVNPDHLEPVTQGENVRRSLRLPTCRAGHPFTTENTKPGGAGRRRCRTCYNAWARTRWAVAS